MWHKCVQSAGGNRWSHLSDRNETTWSITNLFARISAPANLQYESLGIMAGNNNFYKKGLKKKKRRKKYNEKNMCGFLMIWNLKSAITYKCGRVVLSGTSVYFANSKLTLSYSYNTLNLSTFIFAFYVLWFLFFLLDHNLKQVLLIKWVTFFDKKSTISQLSVQTTTTEKEKLYAQNIH